MSFNNNCINCENSNINSNNSNVIIKTIIIFVKKIIPNGIIDKIFTTLFFTVLFLIFGKGAKTDCKKCKAYF